MKREALRGSCALLDGEKTRGQVTINIVVAIAESPEDGHEQARGKVRAEDPGAGAALFELFERDAPMTLALKDGRRLNIVAVSHGILPGGLAEIEALTDGPLYRPGA
jgi:hypothetical protein